ncbi:MAG: HPr kinase/phosphatase C-terminal domain-containing protein, partial [Pseudomonadota bacterium]
MQLDPQNLHASAVALDGRACLITGPSGSGKSALALEMIALGCTLISDDRVVLTRDGDNVTASPAPNIEGLIEARGIGLLRLPNALKMPLALILDLGTDATERLPPARTRDLLGCRFPVILTPYRQGLAAAVVLILR